MDVHEAIETRIEVRSYRDEPVDDEVVREILDAGRLAPSGRNLQHWQFVLVEGERMEEREERRRRGEGGGEEGGEGGGGREKKKEEEARDAGRAVTHMQLAAWERGVGSCIYTVDRPEAAELLEIPADYDLTLVAGFGYPAAEVQGVKDREPLSAVASSGTFGADLEL
jgi:nitroreductase